MSLKTVCRLCLAMDTTFHVVSDSPLQDVYKKLTKKTFNSAGRPVVACYICYSQLWKSHSLMMKAERADELLTQILHSYGEIDPEIVASVDRSAHNLIEGLTISPTYCFEVAPSECNMMELREVMFKAEPQMYPVVETEHLEVDMKQEEPENSEEITVSDMNLHIENIMYNIQDSDVKETTSMQPQDKPTPIPEHILRNHKYKQGETSRNIKTKSANNRQVSPCKSNVEIATKSNNDTNVIENKIKKYICGDCGQSYSNKYQLLEHRGLIEKPYECTQCTFKTNNKSSLNMHLKIHSERTHQCTMCEKKFYGKGNLKTHIRIHTGEKPFECTVCRLKFTHRSSYKRHLNHNKEKPFECDTCKFKFGTKNALVTHIRIHTGERPFKCTICPSSFKTKDALNSHLRSHTGEKRFACTICQQRYSLKFSLIKHILRIHPKEKPFECRACKQKFKDKDTLKIHLKEHSHNRM